MPYLISNQIGLSNKAALAKNGLVLSDSLCDKTAQAKDLNAPSLNLHELKSKRKGDWSTTVNGNWRVTFRFTPDGVELLDYEDYH